MHDPCAVNTNPFLSTLPGDGNGQTLITLGMDPSSKSFSLLAYFGSQVFPCYPLSAKNRNTMTPVPRLI
jgi:hypothetical protein